MAPPPGPDHELWVRAQHGDRDAFTALYHRHAEAVWNHAAPATVTAYGPDGTGAALSLP